MKYVLVVDDQSWVRKFLSQTLQKSNFQVFEAEDGKKGLEVLKENPNIQMIITDLHMPGMDGISFLEALSKDIKFKNIPKLILTTETNREIRNRSKALGAMYWMVKPCSESSLLKAVNEIFQRGNTYNLVED